jgi:hypothetical protein
MEMTLPIKAFASERIPTRTAMAGRFAEDVQEVAGCQSISRDRITIMMYGRYIHYST